MSNLNVDTDKKFADVYLDEIIIFSGTLSEYMNHLQKVLQCLKKATCNLKLNPGSAEYLGDVITPNGFKP